MLRVFPLFWRDAQSGRSWGRLSMITRVLHSWVVLAYVLIHCGQLCAVKGSVTECTGSLTSAPSDRGQTECPWQKHNAARSASVAAECIIGDTMSKEDTWQKSWSGERKAHWQPSLTQRCLSSWLIETQFLVCWFKIQSNGCQLYAIHVEPP